MIGVDPAGDPNRDCSGYLKEVIVCCPHCDREWVAYYEHESELPDDRMVPCSSCEADRVVT